MMSLFFHRYAMGISVFICSLWMIFPDDASGWNIEASSLTNDVSLGSIDWGSTGSLTSMSGHSLISYEGTDRFSIRVRALEIFFYCNGVPEPQMNLDNLAIRWDNDNTWTPLSNAYHHPVSIASYKQPQSQNDIRVDYRVEVNSSVPTGYYTLSVQFEIWNDEPGNENLEDVIDIPITIMFYVNQVWSIEAFGSIHFPAATAFRTKELVSSGSMDAYLTIVYTCSEPVNSIRVWALNNNWSELSDVDLSLIEWDFDAKNFQEADLVMNNTMISPVTSGILAQNVSPGKEITVHLAIRIKIPKNLDAGLYYNAFIFEIWDR